MEKGQGEKSATQELMEEFGIPTYSIINSKSISRSANWQVSSI
jgi:hypothetical protein